MVSRSWTDVIMKTRFNHQALNISGVSKEYLLGVEQPR